MEKVDNFLWTEAYRPRRVAETILPEDLKKTFQEFIKQKNIPNLLLTGRAGVGKTTVARAMLEELDVDYYIINASLNGNIDTLRNDIRNFASSVSFKGGRKYCILDEADYLTPMTQPALRNFMEEYSKNCGFILTCNFKNKIIQPLHSRCTVIDFRIENKDKGPISIQFAKRAFLILDNEKVSYDKAVVVEVVKKYFPDWRRVLNELQRYSASGKIDSGILSNLSEVSLEGLLKAMKEKNFTAVRKWVGENLDLDTSVLFRQFYDYSANYFKAGSIPEVIITLAEYQYKEAFAVDVEISRAACLAEIMVKVEWI